MNIKSWNRCIKAQQQQGCKNNIVVKKKHKSSLFCKAVVDTQYNSNELSQSISQGESSIQKLTSIHDKVVTLLRPGFEVDLSQGLQEKIQQLQDNLQESHLEVHDTEEKLNEAILHYTKILEKAEVIQKGYVQEIHNAQQATSTQAYKELVGQSQSSTEFQLKNSTQIQQQTLSPQVQTQTVQQQEQRKRTNSAQPVLQEQLSQQSNKVHRKIIYNSLQIPQQLKNYWYPVYFTSLWQKKYNFHRTHAQFTLFNDKYVLFQHQQSKKFYCLKEEYIYQDFKTTSKYTRLEYLVFKYLQLPFDFLERDLSTHLLSVHVKDGLIWVWMGNKTGVELNDMIKQIPNSGKLPGTYQIHSELEIEIPVEHGLMVENLLDLAHAPFTHTNTFAKGWPVPDQVKFQAQRILGGHWDPYPIEQSFDIPCVVQSTIGLLEAGKINHQAKTKDCSNHLQQMHICLPVSENRCRVLYRMSMDFMQWTRHIPGIQLFWKQIAGQVMFEDRPLVLGQQYRMTKGGNVWANPVSYDKLALRYRKWRNSVGTNNSLEIKTFEEQLRQQVSSGDMFKLEDPEQMLYRE